MIPRSNARQVLEEGTRLQTERWCRDRVRATPPAQENAKDLLRFGEDSRFLHVFFFGVGRHESRDGSSQLISDVR